MLYVPIRSVQPLRQIINSCIRSYTLRENSLSTHVVTPYLSPLHCNASKQVQCSFSGASKTTILDQSILVLKRHLLLRSYTFLIRSYTFREALSLWDFVWLPPPLLLWSYSFSEAIRSYTFRATLSWFCEIVIRSYTFLLRSYTFRLVF